VLLADEDRAADVAQEVFAKLHQAWATDPRTIEWPWLTRGSERLPRSAALGWWRWWRERGVDLDSAGLRSTVRTPEAEVIGRETQLRIWAAIRRLPLRQREVFALRQMEGLSTDAVAAALGITAGSVKQHLFRAVAHLRRAVGDDA
jgi:RNA polymerase sigma-70 factor (ECF subfamily)